MSGMGIRVGLYYLVANCNTINCPDFCFQNCNQCSNMFPNLTLVGVSRFHIQCMSLGHKYDSWLALLSHLNSQCPCYVFIPSCPCPLYGSIPYSLANPPIYLPLQKSNVSDYDLKKKKKNEEQKWLDYQIRSVIYQKKFIFH